MLIYILRRILYALPIAMGVSLVCFALVHLAPGDPLSAITPEGASPQVIEQIRHAYGFDRSPPVQYYSGWSTSRPAISATDQRRAARC